MIVHRLGEVRVGDASIGVGVSSGHRGAGWRAAEEVLERVKGGAEIWKREWVENIAGEAGEEGEGEGQDEVEADEEQQERKGAGEGEQRKTKGETGFWRANKDRDKDGQLR